MSDDGGLVSAISEIAREIVRQELAKLQTAPVPTDEGERLLSIASVAERTDRSEATVRRWISDGLLPTVAVPGRVKGKEITCVRQSDLDRWIRGLPVRRDGRAESSVGSVRRPRVTTGRAATGRAPVSGLDAEIQKRRERRGSTQRRSAASGARAAR